MRTDGTLSAGHASGERRDQVPPRPGGPYAGAGRFAPPPRRLRLPAPGRRARAGGMRKGMPFRLMVMFTDWDKDKVGDDMACGSMSFCGARDRYPDSRGMGYPFDRPFPNGQSIAQTIEGYDNIAARDINIRWIK